MSSSGGLFVSDTAKEPEATPHNTLTIINFLLTDFLLWSNNIRLRVDFLIGDMGIPAY
jgi:hypothetical protein